ncbi:MAG: long-chain fatty acid--CoA ligase [Limnobacter sp.]|nr:long-chain fatty acid--CoA ligase [Limnobacter sp.]
MNLATPLAGQAARRPDHPAILFEGRTISYGELDAQSSRLAHAMRARGIEAGDRVALFLPNVPEFAVVYYAAQRIGAVPVSINAIFRSAEVEYLVNDSGARVVFTMPDLAGFVVRERCPSLEYVVVVDGPSVAPAGAPAPASAASAAPVASPADGSAGSAAGTEPLSAWIEGRPERFEPVERAPDDPAALLYSSGTTGFPKGVTLTQSNIASNIASAAKYSGYRPDDRLATFLPLFHVYGQNYILNAAILSGATVSLFRRFVPDQVLRAIEHDRITMFFGVPTIFIGLLSMDLGPYDLSSIRYEMSAAATMPEEVSRRWTERFGRRVYEGYGLTECSPFACYNDLVEHRFGSVGRAVEGFELAIFDEEDREQPRGEWGEIVIRGPGVMKGYWNRPEDTERALRGGWLHSGDIGRMDEDGYVYIVDRVKDMINVSGFKVWPAEVEQYLYRMPQVQELAVYGVPHPEKGEQVAVAVVPKAGQSLDAEQVIAWCRESIAAYKVPAIVDIVDELPKSPTGKILKRVLREQAVKG